MRDLVVSTFFAETRPAVKEGLIRHLPLTGAVSSAVFDGAVSAAVGSRGKRLRPLLTLCIARALGGDVAQALPAAVAIEYVHTSSLIIDDLPMMDNTPVRRGQPAVHVQFGESIALLAAIALLNRAYELVAASALTRAADLHRHLTRSIGSAGMIRGQVADLSSRRRSPDVMLKTTALFEFCLMAGGLCADAPPSSLQLLEEYGEALGTAFQLRDDIEDTAADGTPDGDGDASTDSLVAALQRTSRIAVRGDSPQLCGVLTQVTEMFQQFVAAVLVRDRFAHVLRARN